jgi:hypothetical protein
MVVRVIGGAIDPIEQKTYVEYLQEKFPGRDFEEINLEIDGDYVNMRWILKDAPFERIRRITGYLVGNMNRWNNAKAAEEADRVKHGLIDPEAGES